MTSTQVEETSVSTNNSPSHDYTHLDDQPNTNILYLTLKVTSIQVVETSMTINNSPFQEYTRPDDQPDTNCLINTKYDFDTGCGNVGHNQQQSSVLRITHTRTINQQKMLSHWSNKIFICLFFLNGRKGVALFPDWLNFVRVWVIVFVRLWN